MDATVLSLYVSGSALTAGGLLAGALDIARRVRAYRSAVAAAPTVTVTDPRLQALSGRVSPVVAHELRAETQARALGDRNVAKAAGVMTNLRRLWLSAAAALLGVLLSGAADVLATVRAHK